MSLSGRREWPAGTGTRFRRRDSVCRLRVLGELGWIHCDGGRFSFEPAAMIGVDTVVEDVVLRRR